MQRLTKNVGNCDFTKIKPLKKNKVKRILICRPNHRLGNMLLITPLVQEVERTFPDCKIDLFVKGRIAKIIFSNYNSVGRILVLPKKHFKKILQYLAGWFAIKSKRYDLVINVNKTSSSGRLSAKAARAEHKFFGDAGDNMEAKCPEDYCHIAKYPVYNLRYYLTKAGIKVDNGPVPPLNIKLSEEELRHGENVLHELVQNTKKTICLFTYATSRKCYSTEWWEQFYNRLLIEYPGYNIIEVLPVENVSQIGFKAPHFYSKDIREIAALIANTTVFIGADSGMMHLASASGCPVIGLFSVTKAGVYQPYNNYSRYINTNVMDIDESIGLLNETLDAIAHNP